MPNIDRVLSLIDQCDFSAENPFELRESLFPVLKDIASPTIVKLFEKTCYNGWLIFGFEAENAVIIRYDNILSKFSNGSLDTYFGHLSQAERYQIQEKFKEVIDDEIKHSEMFKTIISKMKVTKDYKPEFYSPDCIEFVESENNIWHTNSFIELLPNIVTGESYLYAAFVLFSKYCKNPIKQQIFKEFIRDESRHVAHFMNIMKKAKIDSIEQKKYDTKFFQYAKDRSQFEGAKFEIFLESLSISSETKDDIMQKAYTTEFHQTFRKLYAKKTWQFYNIVFPDVDQETYEKMLYPNLINS
jgi:rubrerythrin